jgi:hypothetical protein
MQSQMHQDYLGLMFLNAMTMVLTKACNAMEAQDIVGVLTSTVLSCF